MCFTRLSLLLLPLLSAAAVGGPGPAATPAAGQPESVLVPAAKAPGQPEDGPGGATYAHGGLTSTRFGEGNSEYWIFEPTEPAPKTAPVVVFTHGWGAMSPNYYGAWIEHLVRRGNIVVFPRYQALINTPFAVFTPNAIAACRAAFRELGSGSHVTPDLTRVAYVGHSMGGCLAANLAALAASKGLPAPKAVMSVEPGDGAAGSPIHMFRADLSKIPKGTLLLVFAGNQDFVVGTASAERIFAEATSVLPADKNLVTLRTDSHGFPALLGDHLAPMCAKEIVPAPPVAHAFMPVASGVFQANAFDYYGTWKLFDALTDAAFYNKHRNVALGDTPEQRYMGKWSDGTPVTELEVRTGAVPK